MDGVRPVSQRARGLRRCLVVVVLLCVAWAASTAAATAQQPATAQPVPVEPLEPLGVSPAGAFLRAVLVPGWGHAAIGSYTRGGFYFALESATAYTFLRTRRRLSEARERAALRESIVRADLATAGITDLDVIASRVGEDAALKGFQDLVKSREGQQEDLVAFGIFLLFLSGADAYVSAHLARFPAPIEVQVSPLSSDRAEIALRIPLPNPR